MLLIILLILVFINYRLMRHKPKGDNGLWEKIVMKYVNFVTNISSAKVAMLGIRTIGGIYSAAAIGLPIFRLVKYHNNESAWWQLCFEWSSPENWVAIGCASLVALIAIVFIIWHGKMSDEQIGTLVEGQRNIKQDTTQLLQGQDKIMLMLQNIGQHLPQNFQAGGTLRSIEKAAKHLMVNTALDMLTSLENDLAAYGNIEVCVSYRIHFLKYLCQKYSKDDTEQQQAKQELTAAYTEMRQCGDSNPEILASMIRRSIVEGNREQALLLRSELQAISPTDPVVVVADIVYATDIQTAIRKAHQQYPEQIEQILAKLLFTGHTDIEEAAMLYALDIYGKGIEPLDEITFDNHQTWMLRLSLAVTQFMRTWLVPIHGIVETPETETFRRVAGSYIEKEKETQARNIVNDLYFIYYFTCYCHDHNAVHIDSIQQAQHSPKYDDIYYLCTAIMLSEADRNAEALQLLKGVPNPDYSLYNYCLVIAIKTEDHNEIVATLREIITAGHVVPDHQLLPFITELRNHFADLADLAPQVQLANPFSQQVYHQLLNHWTSQPVDIDWLRANESKLPYNLVSMVAYVYNDILGIDEVVRLLTPQLNYEVFTPCDITLVTLVQGVEKYHPLAYRLLMSVRANHSLLDWGHINFALRLAQENGDHAEALSLAEELIAMKPEIALYHLLRVQELFHLQDRTADIKASESDIASLAFTDDSHVLTLFEIYTAIAEFDFALDFLYNNIEKTDSQQLLDHYTKSTSTLPQYSAIVHRDEPAVQLGSYVTYTESGTEHSETITRGSLLEDLVGAKVGDTRTSRLFNGQTVLRTITAVHNKYYGMQCRGWQAAQNNQSRAFVMKQFDEVEFKNDPLVFLASLTGETEETRRQREQTLVEYREGKKSLLNFVHDPVVSDMYSKLLGDHFDLHIPDPDVHVQFIVSHLGTQLLPAITLDLSSLLLLEELDCRFQLQFPHKFFLPKVVRDIINSELVMQHNNMPRHLEPAATVLVQTDYPYMQKIRQLLAWIDAHCEVVPVNLKNLPEPVAQIDNEFFHYELQSIFLSEDVGSKCHYALMLSEDVGMYTTTATVSTAVWIYLTNRQHYAAVKDFLQQHHYTYVK